MEQVRLIISGRVQGINFRHFARQHAEKLDIKGFVRNLPNGSVEVVAQGEADNLKVFVRECNRGPLLARIDDVKIINEEPTNEFEGFEVRP